MTVLVTGGAGYIGSHMVHELADAGEPVVVLDNLSTGFRFLIPASVPFIAGSTGDRPLVAEIITRHRISAIIHFAASIVVPDSISDPLGYYNNNTMNTCALLDVAIKAGVQEFIFSSTAAVYGNARDVPVREDAPTAPISPIGKRPKMNIFGTDYSTPDGTCIRDYIHVSDLAQAHSAAFAYLRSGGASATFNCGYGRGASVLEVIAAVRRASGYDFPVEVSPRRPGDPPALVANVERIHAALPWRPRFQNLDTIVSHALAWEKQLANRRKSAVA